MPLQTAPSVLRIQSPEGEIEIADAEHFQQGFVGCLNDVMTKLVRTVDAVRDGMEKSTIGAAAAEAPAVEDADVAESAEAPVAVDAEVAESADAPAAGTEAAEEPVAEAEPAEEEEKSEQTESSGEDEEKPEEK